MYRPPEFSIEPPNLPPDLQARYDAALEGLNATAVKRPSEGHLLPGGNIRCSLTPFAPETVAEPPVVAVHETVIAMPVEPPAGLCGIGACVFKPHHPLWPHSWIRA